MLPRKLRQRFAARSRPVSIRPRRAWYWRALGLVVLISISMAAGHWLYDFSRGIAVGDQAEARNAQRALRERMVALESELTTLRSLAETSDSRLQVEKSAQGQMQQQVKSLEDENMKLKEELAFFENLMPGSKEQRLSIYRFRVEANGPPGEYRYRLLVMNSGGRDARDFQGSYQLVVNFERDARKVIMTLPDGRAVPEPYRLNFKRVQRIEGLFRLEPEAQLKTVQVRVLETGSGQPRASESFSVAAQSLSAVLARAGAPAAK